MAEITENTVTRRIRHRGRLEQLPIYLGKHLRSFVYQGDWKVLPMAAIIAALLSMVVRRDCFITMEGTLKGSFALTCVAIWNGCFNSIQVICRERSIVKREHRSGMHISSYVVSHMIYQALLCLGQTVVTMYVCRASGISFPADSLFTGWSLVDIGVTVFLVSYASDMISLLVSALAHSTTTAMTVMPFLLIFQLVFSGGFFSLPERIMPLSKISVSHYGLQAIAAQGNYNELPMASGWTALSKLEDTQIHHEMTVQQIYDGLSDDIRQQIDAYGLKELILMKGDQNIVLDVKPRDIINFFGEERVRTAIQRETANSSQNADYVHTTANVRGCWLMLLFIAFVCSALSVIVLEFIDRDKRG